MRTLTEDEKALVAWLRREAAPDIRPVRTIDVLHEEWQRQPSVVTSTLMNRFFVRIVDAQGRVRITSTSVQRKLFDESLSDIADRIENLEHLNDTDEQARSCLHSDREPGANGSEICMDCGWYRLSGSIESDWRHPYRYAEETSE